MGRAAHDPAGRERERAFVGLVLAARSELETLYQSDQSDAAKRSRKAAILARLRSDYASLRDSEWGGDKRFDHWFAADLNNARLLPFGLYDQWVPAFECL